MRNFYYRFVKNVFVWCVCCSLVLSYRLVYNEYYFHFHDELEVSTINEKEVYALGKIVGIYTRSNGVFVIDTSEIEVENGDIVDVSGAKIKTGDYILSINGKTLTNKEDMIEVVENSEGKELELLVCRGEKQFTMLITPVKAKNGTYKLGIWVKDDLAGVGTITYFTKSGEFAALGHGMGDGETDNLLEIEGGDLYVSTIVGIEKGKKGNPGEVKGMIYYGKTNHIGELNANTGKGIFGSLDQDELYSYMSQCNSYSVGEKHQVVQGPAYIISEVSGNIETYDIQITYVDYLAMDSNKGLHIKVTDSKLLELTGGIIQGMSGSPIIQNGRIIGAVTHVLINDPTSGYGIFIETMMDGAREKR